MPGFLSTNSAALIEKNGTPASPATAFASRVLPVPGAPTSSTHFGAAPPRRAIEMTGYWRYRKGFLGDDHARIVSNEDTEAASEVA